METQGTSSGAEADSGDNDSRTRSRQRVSPSSSTGGSSRRTGAVESGASKDGKSRRGDLDQRYEYLFTILSFAVNMHRMEILDQLVSTNQLDDVSEFFSLGSTRKLLWFFQEFETNGGGNRPPPQDGGRTTILPDMNKAGMAPSTSAGPTKSPGGTKSLPPLKPRGRPVPQPQPQGGVGPQMRKQLMLTSGREYPLQNIGIYALRINQDKVITEDNIPKEVTCGMATARNNGLLVTCQRLLSQLFIPALTESAIDLGSNREGEIAKKELLGCLHSFASLLNASTATMQNQVRLSDLEQVSAQPFNIDDVVSRVDKVWNIARFERLVCSWMEVLDKVLVEHGQLRREFDDAGPLKELEYWRQQSCVFHALFEQVSSIYLHFAYSNVIFTQYFGMTVQQRSASVSFRCPYSHRKFPTVQSLGLRHFIVALLSFQNPM